MNTIAQTADLTAPEFSHVKDRDGQLRGYIREIPGTYFLDGRMRVALFDDRKVLIGFARSVETACFNILDYHRKWADWITAPFAGKKDDMDVSGMQR